MLSIPSAVCLDSIPYLAFAPATIAVDQVDQVEQADAISETEVVNGLVPHSTIIITATGGLVDAGTSTLSGTFEQTKTVTVSASGTIVVAASGRYPSVVLYADLNSLTPLTFTALTANADQSIILIGCYSFTADTLYLRSTNHGTSFLKIFNRVPQGFTDLSSSNSGGLIAGVAGPLYISTDLGITWVEATGTTPYMDRVKVSSDGTTIIASDISSVNTQNVYKSIDAGLTYTLVADIYTKEFLQVFDIDRLTIPPIVHADGYFTKDTATFLPLVTVDLIGVDTWKSYRTISKFRLSDNNKAAFASNDLLFFISSTVQVVAYYYPNTVIDIIISQDGTKVYYYLSDNTVVYTVNSGITWHRVATFIVADKIIADPTITSVLTKLTSLAFTKYPTVTTLNPSVVTHELLLLNVEAPIRYTNVVLVKIKDWVGASYLIVSKINPYGNWGEVYTYTSTDLGLTWVEITGPLTSQLINNYLYGVNFIDSDYSLSYDYGQLKNKWVYTGQTFLGLISFTATFGTGSRILATNDFISWGLINVVPGYGEYYIDLASDGLGTVVVLPRLYTQYCYYSLDHGNTWVQCTFSLEYPPTSIDWIGDRFIVRYTNGRYYSFDIATIDSWVPFTPPGLTIKTIVSNHTITNTQTLVGLNDVSIMYSNDVGSTWIDTNKPATDLFFTGSYFVATNPYSYLVSSDGVNWLEKTSSSNVGTLPIIVSQHRTLLSKAVLNIRTDGTTFNSQIEVLKSYLPSSVWTSFPSLPQNTAEPASGGLSSSAIVAGGTISSGVLTDLTEVFDGIAWNIKPSLPVATYAAVGVGRSNSFLNITGRTPNDTFRTNYVTDRTYYFDNVSWSTKAPVSQGRGSPGGAGISSSAIIFGGGYHVLLDSTTYELTLTEHFDGTLWSTKQPLSVETSYSSGTGVSTAVLKAGGVSLVAAAYTTATANTTYWGSAIVLETVELFNGTTWSSRSPLIFSRFGCCLTGSASSALCFGHRTRPEVELYNGTSWATTNSLLTVRISLAGAGSSLGALASGGGNYESRFLSSTEFYS